MRALTHSLLLVFALVGFPFAVYSQEPAPKDTFAAAYAQYKAGHYAQARELFQKTQDSEYLLADYSLYYSALIAFNEKDWALSRQLLTELRERYPQSVWFPQTELMRAKMDLAEQKYSQAVSILRSFQTMKGMGNDVAGEALYLQAQAYEAQGDVSQAYSQYQELRASFPLSRWTPAAKKDQARIKENYPDLFPFDTIQSLSDEADQLVRERDYGAAETLYRRLLNNVDDADLRLALMEKLAGLYLSVRKRDEAIPILEQIARDYPETKDAPKALYEIGQILWNRNDNARALDYFKLVMERYPTNSYVERARFAAGHIYESAGQQAEAIHFYSSLSTQFSNSPVRDDATWQLAWLYYRTGDFQQAATTFKELVGQSPEGIYRTAALYWQARAAEKLGDQETAKKLLQQIVNAGEESYYQSLALRGLQRLGVSFVEPKSDRPSMTAESDPPMGSKVSFHLARARELAAISLHQLAVEELDEARRQAGKRTRLRHVLMREYFRNQAYGRSLALANQLPSSYGDRNLYRFPLAYWDTIQEKAQEEEIDPYLVLALIRQESLFDVRARSPAFALGLMQILPTTAKRIAKEIGMAPPSNEELLEPEINLTLGTQYLKDLLQRYSNNWSKAIAAYNAGEAAVDRWEKQIATDDIEEFVERIPYVETRGYVKLVMRNHRIYKKLYAPQE